MCDCDTVPHFDSELCASVVQFLICLVLEWSSMRVTVTFLFLLFSLLDLWSEAVDFERSFFSKLFVLIDFEL